MNRTLQSRLGITLVTAALGLVAGCSRGADAPVRDVQEVPFPCAVSSPTGVYAETWMFSLTATETCGGVTLIKVDRLALEAGFNPPEQVQPHDS